MCVYFYWMLQGVAPTPYRLLDCFSRASNSVLLTNYWGNSYWGGTVAARGALVCLRRCRACRDGEVCFLVWWTGAAIVANSRPYEGLILTVACIVVIVWEMARTNRILSRLD